MFKRGFLLGFLIYLITILIGIISNALYLKDIVWFANEGIQLSFNDIFLHNLQSNAINFLGIISFGCLTVLYLIINGFILGVTLSKCGLFLSLNRIAIHGIFEIIGILLISSIGLLPIWYGIYKYKNLPIDSSGIIIKKIFQVSLLAILQLFIAALIEGQIILGGI